MRVYGLGFVLLSLVSLSGCIFQDKDDDRGGWNLNDPKYRYPSMTFTLSNQGEAPVMQNYNGGFIQFVGPDGPIQVSEPFCNCNQECPQGAPRLGFDVATLYAGQSQSKTWDGTYWQVNDQGCSVERKFEKGTRMDVKFCHHTHLEAGAAQGVHRDTEVCKTIPFVVGEDGKVSHSITPKWPDELLTIELENNTDGFLLLHGEDSCDGASWLSIEQRGISGDFEAIATRPLCGTSTCTKDGEEEASCEMDLGCSAPEEIGAGQQRTYELKLRAHLPMPRYNENACRLPQPLPLGETRIQVCYQSAFPTPLGRVAVECQDQIIELGSTRRVRFEVK